MDKIYFFNVIRVGKFLSILNESRPVEIYLVKIVLLSD